MMHADALTVYRQANRLARRHLSEHGAVNGLLPVFNAPFDRELEAGLADLPLDAAAGIRYAGRQSAFAGNFMPLLPERSEFAIKWQNLCAAHLTEGIRDPAEACEYMGRFYIVEGNKRVSVLKFYGAYSLPAYIKRLVPPRVPGDTDNDIYYEFYDLDPRLVPPIRFSRPGMLASLLRLYPDWDTLYDAYRDFALIYLTTGFDPLPLPAADAFHAFISLYGTRVDGTALIAAVEACEPLFLAESGAPDASLRRFFPHRHTDRLRLHIMRGDSFDAGQDLGIAAAIRQTGPERLETVPDISNGKPGLVISLDPAAASETLRLTLAHPDTRFLQLAPQPTSPLLPVFWPRDDEILFLCGALAASMAPSAAVNIPDPCGAFLSGGRHIQTGFTLDDHAALALIPVSACPIRLPADVFAVLCRTRDGRPVEVLAGLSMRWRWFYVPLVRELLHGGDLPRRTVLGLASGVPELLLARDIPAPQRTVMGLLKQAIIEGKITVGNP